MNKNKKVEHCGAIFIPPTGTSQSSVCMLPKGHETNHKHETASQIARRLAETEAELHAARVRHIGTVEHAGAHLCALEKANARIAELEARLAQLEGPK